jgi:hypothetical protein
MHLRVKGLGGMEWIGVAQDSDHYGALMNMVMNIQVA